MVETCTFALVSIPAMIVLGLRHALDVDHITAIDNLVRLHNAEKRSRRVGGFACYWRSFRARLDTATQISAITLSAVTSATAGVQIALVLTGFLPCG